MSPQHLSLSLVLPLALAAACSPTPRNDPPPATPVATMNSLTQAERDAGWRLLFDGQSTRGWRGFRRADVPAGWQVVDGALTRVAEGAGDIITDDEFDSFELSLDWNVAPAGNSGIFFHVVEDSTLQYVWQTGPEMQVLDNAGHPDGQQANTSAGSNFALWASERDVTRPAGQWNQARLVVDGDRVEHWLNGVKLLEYVLGDEEWQGRVRGSKFADMPRYARVRRGHTALQDHGDRVAYRNIKIRPLR